MSKVLDTSKWGEKTRSRMVTKPREVANINGRKIMEIAQQLETTTALEPFITVDQALQLADASEEDLKWTPMLHSEAGVKTEAYSCKFQKRRFALYGDQYREYVKALKQSMDAKLPKKGSKSKGDYAD